MERTTYTRRGEEHDAVQLSWSEVQAILGHAPSGSPEEEAALIAWLLQHGAPSWVRQAEGWVDEYGWGLIGPTLSGEETEER